MEFKYHFNKSCSMSIARNCGNEYYININRGKNAFPLSFYIDPNRLLKIMEELHRMSGGKTKTNATLFSHFIMVKWIKRKRRFSTWLRTTKMAMKK